MGTWGVGNFDSDHALDYLDGLIAQLVGKVETLIARPIDFKDEWSFGFLHDGEKERMPSLEIVCVLCERFQTLPNVEREQVAQWKDRYLAAYDALIDDYAPKLDYKVNRRRVIVDTFEHLQKIIATGD